MKIPLLPTFLTPAVDDLIPIWDSNTSSTKSIKLSDLFSVPALGGSSSGGGSRDWLYRDNSYIYQILNKDRIIVDSSAGDCTLKAPASPNNGTHFEIFRLKPNNKVILQDINTLNGYNVAGLNCYVYSTTENPIQIIYVNSTLGWISIPKNRVLAIPPLVLPAANLIQQFYVGDLLDYNVGDKIPQWNSSVSTRHATQSDTALQPTLEPNIFGILPGLKFSSLQFFNTDFGYIGSNPYTIIVVEKRTSGRGGNIILGSAIEGFHSTQTLGYGTETSFKIDHRGANSSFSNLPLYNSPISRIWTTKDNLGAFWMYLNRSRVHTGNINTVAFSPGGFIGKGHEGSYEGYIGMVAVYNKFQVDNNDIEAIVDILNPIFSVY